MVCVFFLITRTISTTTVYFSFLSVFYVPNHLNWLNQEEQRLYSEPLPVVQAFRGAAAASCLTAPLTLTPVMK